MDHGYSIALPYSYAVSVIWKLSSSFNVIKVWFGRTIIRSSYKLSYEV